MHDKKFLVMGAAGHVGSKITGFLAERGYDVTGMVRRAGAVIEDPYNGLIKTSSATCRTRLRSGALWSASTS